MISFFKSKFGRFTILMILITIIIIAGFMYQKLTSSQNISETLSEREIISSVQISANQEFVNSSFTSHIPIVIIDTGEDRPDHGAVWDEEKGYPVAVDYDPFAYGTIRIIANENGLNELSDDAILDSYVKLRIRGTSSGGYPKKQYLVKLIDEYGNSKDQDVFSMGSDNEWILNISWQDPSLIRNYLAYSIAKQTILLSPDVQYCEVLYKNGDRYEYLGVYLWMEKINRSKYRVDIPPYRANRSLSFLMRRDRFDEEATILDTYSSNNGLISEYIEVLYPTKEKISEDDVERMEEIISEFETRLYASDTETFLEYRNYININTFVDYFIFNEFFMNYDAGRFSTYFYQDYTGRISIGPVWDYDHSLANDPVYVGEMNTTAMQSAPWFDQLLRDPNFVKAIIDRYHELRETVLSNKTLDAYVDSAIEYLATAANRDWLRWEYDLNIVQRATFPLPVSLQQEINNVKTVYYTHGNWLDLYIDSLYQFSDPNIEQVHLDIVYEEKANDYSEFLAVIFIATVLVSALLLRRET